MNRTLRVAILFYVLFVLVGTAIVYNGAFRTAVLDDETAGRVRLAEATSRLRDQLDVYRALANVFARDSKVVRALKEGASKDINEQLPDFALTYGISVIDITDLNGNVLASSNSGQSDMSFSNNLVQAALDGRLGYRIAVEGENRLVRFSRVVRGEDFEPLGIVIITADLAQLEFQWPVIPEPIAFFDNDGLSVSSNRPYLWLRSKEGEPKFPITTRENMSGLELWNYQSADGEIAEVQVLNTDIPLLQMQGSIFLTTENARSIALLRAGLAFTLLTAFGLIAAIIVQQRRRIALEAQHTRTLEQRVEQRTAELRAAQDELVETSNLAALGRLSAGLSHELNQPLAAILNFAENGKKFIEKSKNENAAQNLEQISEQIKRITRIINNLRAFARQETTPTERVDLVKAAANALKIFEDDLHEAGIKTELEISPDPIFVLAGQIRLEQVISNLISNAKDAMQDSKKKVLSIAVSTSGSDAILKVADTGSGIAEPERVFEPFYSTKELGSSKGLGMGMSLSFGLITHFGGQLSCKNLKKGAEFTITLPVMEGEE